MSPENNNEKLNEKTMLSIINDTEKKSCENECNDTGNQTKYPRQCPDCGKITFQKRLRKERINMRCSSCARFHHYAEKHKSDTRKEWIKGQLLFYRLCPKCGEKVFYAKAYQRNHMEKRDEQCRKCFKMDAFLFPKFNRQACLFFDELNKTKGWNGRHALNGGEYYIERFHYFLDYYEPNLNLVIEWDEPHHKYSQEKDEIRRQNIISILHCQLFIIGNGAKLEDIKI